MRSRFFALVMPVLTAVLATAPVVAQTVFFDDFDGDELLPHWSQPPPSAWEYNVSDSMLNVTGLFSPSHPKSPTNFAIMGAPFAPQTDFQLDARMGWGTAEGVARFEIIVRFNSGLVATLGYGTGLSGPDGIYAGTSAGVVTIAPPVAGIYDFRISRVGAVFNFYFDGDLFASLPSAYTGPVNGLSLYFSSPYPGESGPFHIDRIQVVPSPGMLIFLLSGVNFSLYGRRRTCAPTNARPSV